MIESKTKLLLFLVSFLGAVFLGFFAYDADGAVKFVRNFGYWLMLAAFVLLLINLASRFREVWPGVRGGADRRWLPAALFLALATLLLLTLQPSGYKITMDEPVLAATALQLHEEKEVMTPARAHEINGVFYLLGGYVDKRPFFYPFLVSLLHDGTGYRSSQGVVLNVLLAPVFLGLLFASGRLLWRAWGGYLAVGLFLTVPLLAMNVNSSGVGLLNLTLILATALAARSYLRDPGPRRMDTVILLGLFLAQTRYESVLYVFPVAAAVAAGWYWRGRIFLTPAAVLAPLFLVCFPLQQIILKEYEGFWQLTEMKTTPFSLEYLGENLASAANHFFAWRLHQPNSLLLSSAFVVCLVVLLFSIPKLRNLPRSGRPGVWVSLLFGAGILANFGLLMGYHWGQLDDITATRLVLPFLLLQAMLVVWTAALFRRFSLTGPGLAALLALFFVFVTRPQCARTNFLPWATDQQMASWLRDTARNYVGQRTLFVTKKHIVPLVEKVPAVTVKDGVKNRREIELHKRLGTYETILAAYVVPLNKGAGPAAKGREREKLEANFELEVLQKERLNDAHEARLARVTDVRLGDGTPLEISPRARPDVGDAEAIREFSRTLP